MKILSPSGYIDAVAMFYELDDEQLARIQADPNFFFDFNFLIECQAAKGNNAHFYCLASPGDIALIYKNIKELLKQYKTISWWDRNLKEFKIKKGE